MIGKTNTGATKIINVLVVYTAVSGATITATKSTTTYSNLTDSAGYAYFTNLEEGTWTLTGTKSGLTNQSTTIAILSSQNSYYIELFFARFLYNGDYGEAGASGANVCFEYSHGWSNNGSSAVFNSDSVNSNGGAHFYNGTISGNNQQSAILAEAIDLANYNTLHITSQVSRIDTSKTWYIRYPDTKSGNAYYKWIGTALASATVSSTDIETITIDISNLSHRNVIINFECSYNNVTLYKMWLD